MVGLVLKVSMVVWDIIQGPRTVAAKICPGPFKFKSYYHTFFYSKLTILSYKVRLNLTGPITCFEDLGIATGTHFHFPSSPRVGGRVPNVSLHATVV